MKFCGKIGFAISEEIRPGYYKNKIVEKIYAGDLNRSYYRNDQATSVVGDVKLNNQLSIISDNFLLNNQGRIVYVEMYGTKWTVSAVEINPPRLIIEFQNVYNDIVEEDED